MIRAHRYRIAVAGLVAWIASGLLSHALAGPSGAPMQCVPDCPSETLAAPNPVSSAKSLRFQEVLATRAGDERVYVLLGSGFIRAMRFGEPAKFIKDWMAQHPEATFTPISTMIATNTKTGARMELTYIWVEDGARALNVDLVRKGIFAGATMCDMVDNARGLDRLLRDDPRLAEAKAQIEKERAAAPQDRAERLIPENDYNARMLRVERAEKRARAEKLGIWSNEMKAEREEEGVS